MIIDEVMTIKLLIIKNEYSVLNILLN